MHLLAFLKVELQFLLFSECRTFLTLLSASVPIALPEVCLLVSITSEIAVSSINRAMSSSSVSSLSSLGLLLSQLVSISCIAMGNPLMCTMKATGPIQLPCGTPPPTTTLSDISFPYLVTRDLPLRYDASQPSTAGRIPMLLQLSKSTL